MQRILFKEKTGSTPILSSSIEVIQVGRSKLVFSKFKDDLSARHSMPVKALTVEIVSTIKMIVKLNPFFKEQLEGFLDQVDVNSPRELADFSASLTTADADSLQGVLEEKSLEARLLKVLELLKRELAQSQLQEKIQQQVEESMSQQQRKYLLNEQLKTIKKELGLEQDHKESTITQFRARLEGKKVPCLKSQSNA